MKLRHEYKHYINYCDYLILRQRLRAIMKLDDHTDENGEYKIRSLYFDNLWDKALREKMDGVNNREKFRIRCYNNSYPPIYLEKKSKIIGLTNKASAILTKEQTENILTGNLEWMAKCGEPLILEFYTKMKDHLLRPRTIVDYVREPYVFPAGNVRITLDRCIRSGMNSIDFFDLNAPTIEIEDQAIILEVKYDAYLPDFVRDIVQVKDRQTGSFSKYAACRIYG